MVVVGEIKWEEKEDEENMLVVDYLEEEKKELKVFWVWISSMEEVLFLEEKDLRDWERCMVNNVWEWVCVWDINEVFWELGCMC